MRFGKWLKIIDDSLVITIFLDMFYELSNRGLCTYEELASGIIVSKKTISGVLIQDKESSATNPSRCISQ